MNAGCEHSCRLEGHVFTTHKLLHLHRWKLLHLKSNQNKWSLHKIIRMYFLQGVCLDCLDPSHFSSGVMKCVYGKISMMPGFLKFNQRRLKGLRLCKADRAANFRFHRLFGRRSHTCSYSTSWSDVWIELWNVKLVRYAETHLTHRDFLFFLE